MAKKMNPIVKDKWIKALRSGIFKQGKGKLRSASDELCCLGVACEIAVLDGVIEPAVQKYGAVYAGSSTCPCDDCMKEYAETEKQNRGPYTYGQSSQGLPSREVLAWMGIEEDTKLIFETNNGESKEATFMALNDDYDKSFEEIADLIEAQL